MARSEGVALPKSLGRTMLPRLKRWSSLKHYMWSVGFKLKCWQRLSEIKHPLFSQSLESWYGLVGGWSSLKHYVWSVAYKEGAIRGNIVRPRLSGNCNILLPSRTRTRVIVRKEDVCLLQWYNSHFAFGA